MEWVEEGTPLSRKRSTSSVPASPTSRLEEGAGGTSPPQSLLPGHSSAHPGSQPAAAAAGAGAPLGKQATTWNAPAYRFYLVVMALGLVQMFAGAFSLSSAQHPNYPRYAHKLTPGWWGGRLVDNSDRQYAGFRGKLPLLLPMVLGYWALSWMQRRALQRREAGEGYGLVGGGSSTSTAGPLAHGSARLYPRVLFTLGTSLCFLGALFGANLLKILLILAIHYAITKLAAPRRPGGPGQALAITLVWLWAGGILFCNDLFRGYSFAAIGLGWLDAYSGLGQRWYITFNFCTLRMISFSCDYLWRGSEPGRGRKHRPDCRECAQSRGPCAALRIETPLPEAEYSLLNYLAYVLYAPLFLAGPIITFQDFLAQLHHPVRTITARATALYAARLAGCILLMEFFMHTIYVVAIKEAGAWIGFTPFQIAMIGFFNLKYIWLKLLIIWRFFRLWAMLDQVEVVENMTRCMTNNFSAMGFWKHWHRSYNRWLIRYLYVPLGGSARYAYNIWPIFTFVAVWHDIELRLLVWGWLIALFLLPEYVLTRIFTTPAWRRRLGAWHLHLCALGAVLNIQFMMAANLVGFAVGVDGMLVMLSQILQPSGRSSACLGAGLHHPVHGGRNMRSRPPLPRVPCHPTPTPSPATGRTTYTEGIAFIVTMLFVLFCAVHVMFEIELSKTLTAAAATAAGA